MISLEGKRHTAQWTKDAKSVMKVDLAAAIREEDLTDYLEQASVRYASLINGLSDDTIKAVAQATTNAVINGHSEKVFREKLSAVMSASDSRMRLIAADQIGKLTGDLNEIRHRQAGIEDYIWRTSQDERVRPRHRHLDGMRYKYGEPTGAEEGLPPGRPIRCRCSAQAVVEWEVTPKPARREAPAQQDPGPIFKGDKFVEKDSMGGFGSGEVERLGSGIVANPIPFTKYNLYRAVGNKRFTTKWDKAFREEEIPLETVQTVQSLLDKVRNLVPIKDPSNLPPIKVARVNGQNIILDGNHRSAVLYLQGFKNIKAQVIDLDDPKLASLINRSKL